MVKRKDGERLRIINIGLIGLGGIGRTHFYNSMHLKNARLIAVADISKKARNLAKAKGIKEVHNDYEKLLENPAVDCVIISLPTFLHARCAAMAAEHGKHIFIEKPLARNAKEGKEIVSKVQKAGVRTIVGYPLRFSEFTKIKKEIDNGYLGDVVSVNATIVGSGPFFARTSDAFVPSPVPSWWFEPKLVGGGALIDLGSHMINLLLWYFGDEIVSVKSMLGHRFNMPFEDHALCFIKFRQGISAIINVGWYSLEKIVKVELFGTAKTILMASEPQKTYARVLQLLGIRPLPESKAFYNELDYFIRCIINDRAPSPSAAEAVRDLEIISLAYKNQL